MSASLALQILLIAALFALIAFLLARSVLQLFARLPLPASPLIAATRSPATVRQQKIRLPWPALNDQTPSAWQRNVSWAGWPLLWVNRALTALTVILIISVIFGAGRSLLFCLVMLALIVGGVLWKAGQRRKKFSQQLPDALDALVHGLRAGYALPFALALVERETHEPVSLIFRSLSRAQDYRLTIEQAVKMVDRQLQHTEWTLVAEAFGIQERMGGNIIPVLSKISEGLRDRLRMEQEIQTATASGKFSGLMIASLAPLSFLLFYFFSPEYIGVLIHSAIGTLLLTVAALLELAGFLFIWQIVALDY